MNQCVIYQSDTGGVCVLYPTPEALSEHTIQEIAQKDVPAGKPYKIIDLTDVPSDRTFRAAWTVDPSILTDGVGAESNLFPPKPSVQAGEQA